MATLESLVKKYKDRLQDINRISATVMSNKVISRTPKLSGSLQNSWNANNGPPVTNNVTIDMESPQPLRNNVTAVVNSLKAGDTFSLANGKKYARRIEYEGWSAKAKQGMLRISVAEWQQVVNDAARKANGK